MKKWISAVMVGVMAILLYYIAATTPDAMYGAVNSETVVSEDDILLKDENTLTMWYTDDALSDYLNAAALSFQKKTGIKVNLSLVSGVEYLEDINRVSVSEAKEVESTKPDLYITTHDNLLRAHLSNLAATVNDKEGCLKPEIFPSTALHAVTCYDNYVAYPLYYETNFFLYNKTYMASIAENRIKEDAGVSEEETALEGDESDSDGDKKSEDTDSSEDKKSDESDSAENNDESDKTDATDSMSDEAEDNPMGEEDSEVSEEVLERLANMIPSTIDDITTFANNYDAPEAVESVFKWDISDIFYNYFFVGNYVLAGGEDGDDTGIFTVYSQQAVDCLKVYQNMNQFFSIDSKEVSYDSILQEFIDGKTVFTVATTDAISRIEAAKEAGEFEYDYGVTYLPDISSLLKARGLSVTSCVAVNGYSDKQDIANDFAKYLCVDKGADLYKKTGKVSCLKSAGYDNEVFSNIMDEYEKSVPLPKMMEASNYWVKLEIAFTKIWEGADPDETLKNLSDEMNSQIDEIRIKLPTQESFSKGGGAIMK